MRNDPAASSAAAIEEPPVAPAAMASVARPPESPGPLEARSETRVLDCTIRDGGLMNRHHFDLPYMLTGLYNQHPRAAIEFNAATVRGDIGSFFETVAESR